jgi:hypothetical protein
MYFDFEYYWHLLSRDVLARHTDTPQIAIDYRKLTTEPSATFSAVIGRSN